METIIDLYRNDNKAVIDAFDRIVVNIFMEKEKRQHKSFLICGCDAGAGSTSISVELAISMSVAGWKTVLIDADLRKDSKYKRLNQKTEVGLSDYIIHEDLNKSIIYQTNWSGLDYIACGKEETETPVKMLCSSRMGNLLGSLYEKYDFVIFDVPSLNSAVDAKILSSKVDCTYLVVASEQTGFANLTSAKEQLKEAGANVAGVILNKVPFDEYGRYVKDYDYFNKKQYMNNKFYNQKDNKKEKKTSSAISFIKKLMGCFLLFLLLSVSGMSQNVFAASTDNVRNSEDGELPVVIATQYSVKEGNPAAGGKCTLNIHIENMSRRKAAYQLSMTAFIDTENVYLQQGETNQRYIEYFAPRAYADFELKLAFSDKIEADCAMLELRFDYVNEEGKVGTNTTTISPEIDKGCKLDILSVTTSTDAKLGSKALFNIRYQNDGETEIKNVKMRIEGNIENAGEEISIEAPEIGRQKYLDQYIVFTETGNQTLEVYLSYEDEDGNQYNMEPRRSETLVMNSVEEEKPVAVAVKTETKNNKKLQYLAVWGGALILGTLCLAVVIKKIRGKNRTRSKAKRKWCFISLVPRKKGR